LDGTQLVGSFAGNRLKKFFSRADLDRARTERQAVIRVRNDLEDEEEDAERVGDEMNDEGDLII
jgi:hypothetical protein